MRLLQTNLKTIRVSELGKNQREFSNLLDLPERQYYRYETLRSYPSLEIAFQIAKKLDKKLEDIWFFDDTDENV